MLSLICYKVAAIGKLFICVSVIVCLKNAFFPHRKTCHFTQWETCKTLYARGRIIVVMCSVVCGYLKLFLSCMQSRKKEIYGFPPISKPS